MGSREGGLAAAKTLKQKYGDTFYANAQKCNEIPDNLNNRKGDVKK